MEADITGQGTNLNTVLIGREISVAGSDCQPCFYLVERYQWQEVTATDISPPIKMGQFSTPFHKPYLRSAEEDRLVGGLI